MFRLLKRGLTAAKSSEIASKAMGEGHGEVDELQSQFDEQPQSEIEAKQAYDSLRSKMFGQPATRMRLGRFELVGKLGSGGMGVVWEAFDPEREQRVALKTLAGFDPQKHYRLKREFRALAEVTHENLVELYELHIVDKDAFFSMELVDGLEFNKHLHAADHGAIRAAFRQLAGAIEFLHQHGKLHLDIKPANVLVTHEGRVVLLDFGLVRELRPDPGRTTVDGAAGGTPRYVAPEQAAGKDTSPASDWYSVGVMLYETLCGKVPFHEQAARAILLVKQDQLPDPPSSVASVPEDLNRLCMELLQPDPAKRPQGAEVLRRLGVEPEDEARTPASWESGVFVGRTHHQDELEQAFEDSAAGQPVTVNVHGDPGVGKTALVSRFLERLSRRRNVVVLAGRCYQHESVPYPAFDSLVDALMRYLLRLPAMEAVALMPRDIHALAQLFPVLLRVRAVADAPRPSRAIPDAQEFRRRAFAALKELLARIADRCPLVLFIDDLQWGDIDSARLLGDLRRPPDPPAMLFIAAYRSEGAEANPVLGELLAVRDSPGHQVDMRELPVEPLQRSESEQLACDLLGRPIDEVARTIARKSEGYPLFVSELVRDAANRAGAPETEDVSLPQVLDARIRELPVAARRLLEVVAIAGAPIEDTVAGQAAHVGTDAHRARSTLQNGHLIRVRRTGERAELECYHDRIRETVVARMDEGTFRSAHLKVAEALETSRSAEPSALAMHFQAAGEPERALRYTTRSAERATEAMAFDRAAALYRLSLELADHTPERRRELQTKLGHALANAGRGPEAADAYLSAVEGAPSHQALDLRQRAMAQLLRSGHLDRGRAVMHKVLASVELSFPTSKVRAIGSNVYNSAVLRARGFEFPERPASDVPPEELARLDAAWSVHTGLAQVEPLAWPMTARHLRMALRVAEPSRVANAMALFAWWQTSQGATEPAKDLLERAGSIAKRAGEPYSVGVTKLIWGAMALYGGEFQRSLEVSDEAAATFEEQCTGASWEASTANFQAEVALTWLGEIKEASRRIQRYMQFAAERGDLQAFVTRQACRISSWGWLAADDPERARAELRAALAAWSQDGFHVQHFHAVQAEATIALYEGNYVEGYECLLQQWPLRESSMIHRSRWLRIWSWVMRGTCALAAASVSRDPDALVADGKRSLQVLERESLPFTAALATSLRACIAAAEGKQEPALTLLDQALPAFDALDLRLGAACLRRQKGRLVGGDGGRELVAAADAFMAEQDILDPKRIARTWVPGFDRLERDEGLQDG